MPLKCLNKFPISNQTACMLCQSEALSCYQFEDGNYIPNQVQQAAEHGNTKICFRFDLESSQLFLNFVIHLSTLLRDVVYFDSRNKNLFLISNWHQLSLILRQLAHEKTHFIHSGKDQRALRCWCSV